jgi:hypothetical protein
VDTSVLLLKPAPCEGFSRLMSLDLAVAGSPSCGPQVSGESQGFLCKNPSHGWISRRGNGAPAGEGWPIWPRGRGIRSAPRLDAVEEKRHLSSCICDGGGEFCSRFTTWMSLAKGITSVVGEAEHAVMRQAAAGLFSFDSTLPEQTKEAFLALNVFFGTGFMLLGPESLGSANPDPFSVFELMRYLHMHLVEATEWLGWSTRDVGKSDTTSPGSPEASPSS